MPALTHENMIILSVSAHSRLGRAHPDRSRKRNGALLDTFTMSLDAVGFDCMHVSCRRDSSVCGRGAERRLLSTLTPLQLRVSLVWPWTRGRIVHHICMRVHKVVMGEVAESV
jgi:hypothetical protein